LEIGYIKRKMKRFEEIRTKFLKSIFFLDIHVVICYILYKYFERKKEFIAGGRSAFDLAS